MPSLGQSAEFGAKCRVWGKVPSLGQSAEFRAKCRVWGKVPSLGQSAEFGSNSVFEPFLAFSKATFYNSNTSLSSLFSKHRKQPKTAENSAFAKAFGSLEGQRPKTTAKCR